MTVQKVYKSQIQSEAAFRNDGAGAEAAIEDLTEANIDSWTPPTFE